MRSYDEKMRRFFQQVKSMSVGSFQEAMNVLHTRAYAAAERHYSEAMDIVLQPKKKAAVIAKATEIRELWDGMATVETSKTVEEVFAPEKASEIAELKQEIERLKEALALHNHLDVLSQAKHDRLLRGVLEEINQKLEDGSNGIS